MKNRTHQGESALWRKSMRKMILKKRKETDSHDIKKEAFEACGFVSYIYYKHELVYCLFFHTQPIPNSITL